MKLLKKSVRSFDRLVELAPAYIFHPTRLGKLVKGVHPGLLPTLDQPWLKALAPTVVLDVGANIGQFSFAARSVFPDALIYAFEPLPACFIALNQKMKNDHLFRGFATAIGSSDGNITIHESTSTPSSSILAMNESHTEAFPWTEGGRDIEVALRRLDTLTSTLDLEGTVLLKIDVQGYGMEVLRGANETLRKCELVIIETSIVALYDGDSTFDEVYEYLHGEGFRFVGAFDQLRHPISNEILQLDALFKRISN